MIRGKYDLKIMDIFVGGVKTGELFRPRSAREAAEDRWQAAKLRKEWNAAVKNAKPFKTPIFGKGDK